MNETQQQRLKEIEARADAATAGPWATCSDGAIRGGMHLKDDGWVAEYGPASKGIAWQNNGAFIAAARTDVPALCKALRRAVKTLESNAVPRLGGKQQQYEAQAALTDIAAILSGEEGQ